MWYNKIYDIKVHFFYAYVLIWKLSRSWSIIFFSISSILFYIKLLALSRRQEISTFINRFNNKSVQISSTFVVDCGPLRNVGRNVWTRRLPAGANGNQPKPQTGPVHLLRPANVWALAKRCNEETHHIMSSITEITHTFRYLTGFRWRRCKANVFLFIKPKPCVSCNQGLQAHPNVAEKDARPSQNMHEADQI